MNKIKIKASELKEIVRLIQMIPESADNSFVFVTLEESTLPDSGITLTAAFPYKIDGIKRELTKVITGVETW